MGLVVTAIRPMVVDDLGEVVALESQNQPRPWPESVFRGELAAPNRTYLVAQSDRVIGFAGAMVIGDEAHVTNLLVSPEQRGRGVGRSLMVGLIEAAIERAARHLTLEVRSSNEAARRLYAGLGLAPVGVRPRYYCDDDALIMLAHDIDQPEFLERLR
jgi:ribosomal-protein-alanine N-acetyltransferase